MVSNFVKAILILASMYPVFLVLWFTNTDKTSLAGIIWLVLIVLFTALADIVLRIVNRKLEYFTIKATNISPIDRSIVFYIVLCFLPILSINPITALITIVFFTWLASCPKVYFANPILELLGYRFYRLTIQNGKTYILIARRQIYNVEDIKYVAIMSNGVLIDINPKPVSGEG